MTYFNIVTLRERSFLPALADVSNPTWTHYYARGWREVVPFTPPDGYIRKTGTRTVSVVGDEAHEQYEVWTQAEADAQAAADLVATKDAAAVADNWDVALRAFAKLVFNQINTLRARASLPEYTWEQFKTALRVEMDR